MRLSRTAYYQPPLPASRRDAAVIAGLTGAVARYPRWGFWQLFDRLRADGRPWNHTRVHRVYCALRLHLPRRATRRVPRRIRQPLTAPPVLNQTWALDFMTETLYDGRRVQLLTIMDEGHEKGWSSRWACRSRVARLPRPQRAGRRAWPAISRPRRQQPFVDWCAEHGVATHDIQPGKPDQNASAPL